MIDNKCKCIPFHIEINRVIELLAKQIYQTPMALLRENCQNAFDAVLIRRHAGQTFSPQIDITIASDEIRVKDNGIGMTTQDLETHFWRAGSSGKNTPEARAAGVVGTFGIGAMANFGVASELYVITESAVTMERTKCIARRDTLSATENCIDIISENPTGEIGTSVIAKIQTGTNVNISEATNYITEIVKHLDIPVFINGAMVSKRDIYASVPRPPTAWEYSEENATIGPSIL
jgi:molecular chaperone HtpG